jgi:hypothetical protein
MAHQKDPAVQWMEPGSGETMVDGVPAQTHGEKLPTSHHAVLPGGNPRNRGIARHI